MLPNFAVLWCITLWCNNCLFFINNFLIFVSSNNNLRSINGLLNHNRISSFRFILFSNWNPINSIDVLLSLLRILLNRRGIVYIDVSLLIRIVLIERLLYDSHMRSSIDDVNLLVYHCLNIYSNQKTPGGRPTNPIRIFSFRLLDLPSFLCQQHAYMPASTPIY
jgi:hypothetical protein